MSSSLRAAVRRRHDRLGKRAAVVAVAGAALGLAPSVLAGADAGEPRAVRIVVTDLAGTPVRETRLGQVLRITARSTDGRRVRVCVDRVDPPYCASPLAPGVLVRRVRTNLVVDGWLTVRAIVFPATTVSVRSIPVVEQPRHRRTMSMCDQTFTPGGRGEGAPPPGRPAE